MSRSASRDQLNLSDTGRLYETVSIDFNDRELKSSDPDEGPGEHESSATGVKAQRQCGLRIPWRPRVKHQARERKLQGWRFGVAISAAMTTTVLLINTIFTVWASFHYGLKDGIGTIYTGDCAVVSTWSLRLHILVNALGSAMFGASNYTMQCLMAPTRNECDRAHARGDWLDIGVPSFRNLTRIPWRRRFAWFLLALSSVPVHFLYNSAVFKELYNIQGVQFVRAVAGILRHEELDLAIFSKHNVTAAIAYGYAGSGEISEQLEWYRVNESSVIRLREWYLADHTGFDRLNPQQCIDLYGGGRVTGYSHGFAIVDPNVKVNISTLSTFRSWRALGLSQAEAEAIPMYWPIEASDLGEYSHRDNGTLVLGSMYFDRCVVKREAPHCKLQYSMHILVVVILCNLTKLIIMTWYLRQQCSEILVTFGDSLASWLEFADENTKGHCLAQEKHVRRGRTEHDVLLAREVRKGALVQTVTPREAPKSQRWATAIGLKQWMLSLSLCASSLLTVIAFLIVADRDGVSVYDALSTGNFFTEDTASTVRTKLPTAGAKGLMASVLLVNTPQLIFSCCYLAYNGLLTGMHQAHEYSRYAVYVKAYALQRHKDNNGVHTG